MQFGNLGVVETTEKFQLNQLPLARVNPVQVIQGSVQVKQFLGMVRLFCKFGGEPAMFVLPAILQRQGVAGKVCNNESHGAGAGGKKMLSVIAFERRAVGNFQEQFIDHHRGGQGGAAINTAAGGGHSMQHGVDSLIKAVHCLLVTLVCRSKKSCDRQIIVGGFLPIGISHESSAFP